MSGSQSQSERSSHWVSLTSPLTFLQSRPAGDLGGLAWPCSLVLVVVEEEEKDETGVGVVMVRVCLFPLTVDRASV